MLTNRICNNKDEGEQKGNMDETEKDRRESSWMAIFCVFIVFNPGICKLYRLKLLRLCVLLFF